MDIAAETNTRKQFREAVDRVTTFKPETLTRPELGEISFVAAEPVFRRINEFFETVKGASWDRVPAGILPPIIEKIGRLLLHLERAKAFTVRGNSNPETSRNQIASAIEQEFNHLYTLIVPNLTYEITTAAVRGFGSQLEEAAGRAVADATNLLERTRSEAATTRANLEGAVKVLEGEQAKARAILLKIEEDAKRGGVTREAVYFKELADQYLNVSLAWLAASLLFAAATLAYLWNASKPQAPAGLVSTWQAGQSRSNSVPRGVPGAPAGVSGTNAEPVPVLAGHAQGDMASVLLIIFPRAITITVLLTGLIFSLRNYAAASHNRVVNKHRQTALSTFEVFVLSTADEQTKNAVLLQATQAIFSPQPSGYLKSENEVSQVPQVSLIADIVRGSAGKPEK
jgi:hypothetical protein